MKKMALILALSLAFSSQAAFATEPVQVVAPVVAPELSTTLVFIALGVAGVAAAASGGSSSTPQH